MGKEKPKKDEKKKVNGVLCCCGFFVLVIFIIFVASSCGSDEKNTSTLTTKTPTPIITTPTPTIKYTFDVPSLIGKSVTEIRKALGEPTKTTSSMVENYVYNDAYDKGDVHLDFDYANTGDKISNVWLILNKNGTKDNYLTLYNLEENDSRYELKFIEPLGENSKKAAKEQGSDYASALVSLK